MPENHVPCGCGGVPLMFHEDRGCEEMNTCYVRCPDCGTETIHRDKEEDAWFSWDRAMTPKSNLVQILREELTHQRRNNHARNLALDALHYVWCAGGCASGTHRWQDEKITLEIVEEAIRNTKRLINWWNTKEFKTLDDKALPAICSREEYCRRFMAAEPKPKCVHTWTLWGSSGGGAQCVLCGETSDSWYCPKSLDHLCHYDNGNYDQCDFCGEPEERK